MFFIFNVWQPRKRLGGKEKIFNEGQEKQILDTLFFDFIDLTNKLKPKMVIAENVTGLLMGNAKKYFNRILIGFNKINYHMEHFILDASKMGVPQKRKRIFFIGLRKDLINENICHISDIFKPILKLNMRFNEKEIIFDEIYEKNALFFTKFPKCVNDRWLLRKNGDTSLSECDNRLRKKRSYYGYTFVYKKSIINTITSTAANPILFDEPRFLSKKELIRAGTFPHDFNFLNVEPRYAIGMSVPPLMMYKISKQLENILKYC